MSTQSDSCIQLELPQPQPFIAQKKDPEPPTVFVDTSMGYIAKTGSITPGYMNTTNRFFSIAENGGFNAFVTDETVGIGFFVEKVLYAVLNVDTEDFFGIELEEHVERSIVTFARVSRDTFLLVVCANIDPATGKILYISKTITIDSLYCSMQTRVIPNMAPQNIKDEYSNIIDDDLNVVKHTSELGRVVDPAEYNGSYGFADLREVEITTDSDTRPIYEAVLEDLKSTIPGLSDSVQSDIALYSIWSDYIRGGLFLVLLCQDKLITIKDTDTGIEKETFMFDSALSMYEFDNIYFPYVMPATRDTLKTDYVFCPYGVLKENYYYKHLFVNRIEDSDGGQFIKLYVLELPSGGDKYVPIVSNGKMVSLYSLDVSEVSDSGAERSIFFGNAIGINTDIVVDTTVCAYNYATYIDKSVTERNQTTDIISVRTMCEFVDYLYF